MKQLQTTHSQPSTPTPTQTGKFLNVVSTRSSGPVLNMSFALPSPSFRAAVPATQTSTICSNQLRPFRVPSRAPTDRHAVPGLGLESLPQVLQCARDVRWVDIEADVVEALLDGGWSFGGPVCGYDWEDGGAVEVVVEGDGEDVDWC